MTQTNRLDGGLINRSQTYSFKFDGKSMQGHEGDTLRQHCWPMTYV